MHVMLSRGLCIALLALLVAACSSVEAQPTDAATGLPILERFPPLAGSVAATEWNDSQSTPEGFGPDDTVHADLVSLVGALRGIWAEQDVRATMGFIGRPTPDAASIVAHVTGRDREDIVGDELVMEVRRNERGWYVEGVQHRMHCGSGLDPETGFCS